LKEWKGAEDQSLLEHRIQERLKKGEEEKYALKDVKGEV